MSELEYGKDILVSAHGNSLRSIVMHIDGLNEEEVLKLEIPTGKPIIYDYENGKLTKE
jgi:2,3-bisphosphoglycerate-dependent phosphoglycerate mutase